MILFGEFVPKTSFYVYALGKEIVVFCFSKVREQ
jgi:hypothetical protein